MFNKSHPFLATIKERSLLSHSGTLRQTYHIVLDLAGSGYSYEVGDSIGVLPINDPDVVQKTILAMKAKGDEIVFEKNSDQPTPLLDFLTTRANLRQFSRKIVTEIAARQTNIEKKEHLLKLLNDTDHTHLKAFQELRHVWDVLSENEEVSFTPQELCLNLMPMLPRLYSIASSQNVVGNEVHLTVAHLAYQAGGYERQGVCTSYLCQRAPLERSIIPVYIQPHHGFTLPPSPSTPIIMVGPGTGVAPFRAFMQERSSQKATGKNWLFFGEWNRDYDFFYENFWSTVPHLRVTTAFSRDLEHKVYVQHRLLEHSRDIYQWIQEGAIFYVCGNAQRMAKDVDAALHEIIESEGQMTRESARAYIKLLRQEKRYLRDIY